MKVILVTGANRTGTTWVGRMLSFSGKILWVYEPFNHELDTPRFAKPCPFDNHFHAVVDSEVRETSNYLRRRILAALPSGTDSGEKRAGKAAALLRAIRNATGLLTNTRQILFKDPNAMISAEWIADEFDSRVVVLIRHPAAYVASIKRVNWPMNPETLLEQPAVVERLPESIVSDAVRHVGSREKRPGFSLEDTAYFWNLLYSEVDRYRREHPDWIFLRHEDLSLDYENQFRELYSELGLPWRKDVESNISAYCNRQNTRDPGSEIMVLKRDSRATVSGWKTSLDRSEVETIRNITAEVTDLFYDDEWWDPDNDP